MPLEPPSPLSGQWRLAFQDEFDGDQLDLGKWRPNWLSSDDTGITKPVNSAELSCYDPAQVSVGAGSARLSIAERECRDDDGRLYSHASGLIQSAQKYEFSYGYAEARLFLSPEDGNDCGPNWPAFWINAENPEQDGEIDVMECLSRNQVSWHYHHTNGTTGGSPRAWYGTMPETGGWHTFGVLWQAGRLDFYYDDVHVGRATQDVTGARHYLIVNLAASGSVITEETLSVDYVRVWQEGEV